jgi:hypothetical protein
MSLVYTTSYAAETSKIDIEVSSVPANTLTLITESADQVEESLVSAPLDRPEIWTFGSKQVADVYRDTTVPSSAKPASSRGVQIMVRHDSSTTVTDSADTNYYRVLPFASWICVRVPVNELITADQVLEEVKRMFGGVLRDEDTSGRLAELIRNALKA